MANYICPDHNPNKKPCYYFIENGFCSSGKWFRCIEYIRRKKPIISHSACESYTRCLRLFYNSWILGWKPLKVNVAPTIGNLWHGHAATFHADSDFGVERGMADIKKYEAQLVDPYKDDGSLLMAAQIVPYQFQGYRKACREGRIRMFKGEAEFPRLMEFDNFTLKARMDLCIGKRGEVPVEIVDYKYVKSEEYYTFFTTRFQALIYLYLTGAEKITFRCMLKPKLRQGKNETEQEFLERVRLDVYNRPGFYVKDATYYRSEYDFDSRLREMGRMADEIRKNVDDPEAWWQSPSQYCLNPFRCDFYDACTSGVFGDNIYKRVSYEMEPEGSKG